MVKRNPHIAKLQSNYFFPEIVKRKQDFLKKNPHVNLISLGIGDTTEPIPETITHKLSRKAISLSTTEGYSGYGPEEGELPLRQLIAKQIYQNQFDATDIFISDGTNSDIGRLQILFGSHVHIAVQDPSYPVYVDTSVILGQTSSYFSSEKKYQGITYLSCLPSNQFFPSFSAISSAPNIIYFCSPNNPTGATATYSQLEELVDYASRNRVIVIYDTAYSWYIQEPHIPRSIYEIKGAKEVAIELGSFSKMAGFTGVRLAWSVVPKELQFEDGHSVQKDWNRVHSTFFNGASNISQAGGMAVLQEEGQKKIQTLIQFYMQNATLLHQVFVSMGYEVYGGVNAPYLWVKFPLLNSWQAFEMLLEKAHLVTAPGSGFGPAGEQFLRFSAFGKRSQIEEAANRLETCLR